MMTEMEFAERLKSFRKAKNMTQQELADKLGVSNKSVSRWESGGGYPDVALLAPLAKALDVTVDDLLCDTPPVRKLGTAEWQNLLSFAFAIGGGALYFLFDLFMPALVCYCLYIAAMAYGVYLQNRYTYRSQWFRWANAGMNFFVNAKLLSGLTVFALTFFSARYALLFSEGINLSYYELTPSTLFSLLRPLLLPAAIWLALSAGLTALTQYLIRWKLSGDPLPALRLEKVPMTWRKAVPALLLIPLVLFWAVYSVQGGDLADSIPAPLPKVMYQQQSRLFLALAAVCALLSILPFLKKGRRAAMLPSLGLVGLACLALPRLADYSFVYSSLRDTIICADTSVGIYSRFGMFSWTMLVWMVVLVLLYLLASSIRIKVTPRA